MRYQGRFRAPTPTPTGIANVAALRSQVGRFYKDYQLVDLGASFKFLKNYMVTFSIKNLFDVDFYSPIVYGLTLDGNGGYTANNRNPVLNSYQTIIPRRNFYLSFRYEF